MAGEWRETTLGAEADILLGFAFKSAEFSGAPPGHRLVRGDNVKRGFLQWGPTARYWRHMTPDLARYRLREGDVVIGMDGSRVGENFAALSQHDLPALLVQRVACLRGRGRLDQGFLRYLVCNQMFTAYIKAVQTGTSIPHISGGQIGDYPVVLPPLHVQRAITHVLGVLDERIDLNHRMSETLEVIPRALYRSWFVDFDPVRAKAEGRDPGLPAHLADLFPDSFEDSELGQIPAGWVVISLGEILDLEKGLSYKGQYLGDAGIPMLSLGCFSGDGRFNVKGIKHYSGEFKARHVVVPRDLLIANTDLTQKREVLGSPALVPPQGYDRLLFSHHLFAVRFHKGQQPWKYFVYYSLLQNAFRERAAGFATGTTVLALPRDAVLKLRLVAPPIGLREAFDSIAVPAVERRWEGLRQSGTLAAIRDGLLPKLISGEFRLKDAWWDQGGVMT